MKQLIDDYHYEKVPPVFISGNPGRRYQFFPANHPVKETYPQTGSIITLSKQQLQDKIKGGWAGQVIGVTYGGPRNSGTWEA